MVGERVVRNLDFLKHIAKTRSPNVRRELVEHASADEILAIVEICLNVLRSRFPLNTRQRHKLKQHADYLRRLARVRTEKSARSLLQVGDGVAIASLLIPVIAEIARTIIQRI